MTSPQYVCDECFGSFRSEGKVLRWGSADDANEDVDKVQIEKPSAGVTNMFFTRDQVREGEGGQKKMR